ncbi:MAG TPA: D-arabinono-1,4-lactone oxidase [Acidimicrobiales bacterium]|nr:D-arabinono-1,4-lactone oxidase [Acidimicrobiales bacterium]
MGAWKNWAGNQQCAPARVEHPAGAAALADVVRSASRVKVVGSGHSFTDIAVVPDGGVQVVLDRHSSLLSVDRSSGRVTAQAGMTLLALNRALSAVGLALPNLGDIAYQTVAGAVSTATHGTGIGFGGIATQIVGLELVAADGTVVRASADEEPEVFACARVGLGALGVLSSVTLQCVPAFRLQAVEEPMRLGSVLRDLDRHVEENDHFEFFYVPHTDWALTKRNNRTDAPVGGMPRWKWLRDKVLMENVAFGSVVRLGRRRPSLIPRLATALPSSGRTEYVKPSHDVFASPRWVHFYEMEYSVPREAGAECLQRVRKFIDDSGLRISFPIEVRFTAGDDIPLSTAYGGERCYIAVHVYRGMEYERYFRHVEKVMRSVGGRPHWGKLHYRTAEDLAPVYPEWDRFQAVRRKLDPDGKFANAYLDRVLGSVP